MTQQPDNQNVAEKRDQSSSDQDTPVDSNLNDLVSRSRQATREADEALKNAGQGGQPGGQPVQEKGQGANAGQQSTASQDTKRNADGDTDSKSMDKIADPNQAQGSASDGDPAS